MYASVVVALVLKLERRILETELTSKVREQCFEMLRRWFMRRCLLKRSIMAFRRGNPAHIRGTDGK